MPLVSVILPVYNGEKTIRKTINSVLEQTFSDFELIVINDGSEDATLDRVADIKDSRIRVFSYTNSGVSASRNRGISHAVGDYISFIDADDLWTADKLEAQLTALQNHPQADVAYSWTDWIDETDRFLRPGGHITANGSVYETLLLQDFVESGSNVLVCKQALLAVGGFDESLSFAEDWDLWLRLAKQYEFVAVPSSQVLYRISTNSASFNVRQMEVGSLQVIERAFQSAPESLQALKRNVLASRYKYFALKSIEGTLERRRGLAAIRLLAWALYYDPRWLQRTRLMAIIVGKIAIAILLSPQQAQTLLEAVKSMRKRGGG